jgi:hypothetical protein
VHRVSNLAKSKFAEGSQSLIKGKCGPLIWSQETREFGYREKRGEQSSNFATREVPSSRRKSQPLEHEEIWTVDLVPKNFARHEVPIREGESRTVGSRGLWTVDLMRAQVRESEERRQEIFRQRETRNREALVRFGPTS